MRTKKKTVEQEKNRNSQKSVKSVQLMGMGVYGGKEKLLRTGSVFTGSPGIKWKKQRKDMIHSKTANTESTGQTVTSSLDNSNRPYM